VSVQSTKKIGEIGDISFIRSSAGGCSLQDYELEYQSEEGFQYIFMTTFFDCPTHYAISFTWDFILPIVRGIVTFVFCSIIFGYYVRGPKKYFNFFEDIQKCEEHEKKN
jgi:hypothetical protein